MITIRDGYLLVAEAGAQFSGLEFSGQYSATLFAGRIRKHIVRRKISIAGATAQDGGAGLRPLERYRADLDVNALIADVQAETLPVEKFYRRDGEVMQAALDKLNRSWAALRAGLAANPDLAGPACARSAIRAREAAAMTATAHWIFTSALERKESRGLHRRADYPVQLDSQHSHVIVGGLDQLWVKRRPVLNTYLEAKAS